jgi:hypothetical protein
MLDRLGAANRRLAKDIEAILDRGALDQHVIVTFQDAEAQWVYLLRLRAVLVRGVVVDIYATVDDMLGSEIAAYFFRGVNFPRMWKSEKFKRFNFYILERLPTIQKLALVRDILNLPKAIFGTIEAMNSLRNEVAHALFPENLRAHRNQPKSRKMNPMSCPYKGGDVFTPAGFDRLLSDMEDIRSYFRNHRKVFRKRELRNSNKNKMISFV